ncbi:MAG: hypothetical protein J7L62_02270 [Candidatus Aminicenantes bacterium]|nr:hypothetical protein [Candidatus Aminicenantes bacterium]
MNVLYIISKSPLETREPFIGISLAEKGDTVVFVGDGAIVKQTAPWEFRRIMEEKEKEGVKMLFLKEDLDSLSIDYNEDEVIDRLSFFELMQSFSEVMQF